jgi:hypothetical protein
MAGQYALARFSTDPNPLQASRLHPAFVGV